ncbi:MAG: nucleoside 2-deoxyribosyltransferase [Chloroflexota bacterium]|nr:nucleoside 2-deoxyribosyltransferase [Chloroflexota bacterium]
MQIGNPDLDHICNEVIFPAIVAAGLEPRRVDSHNQGDLLKSEIVAFLERAEIIVADITNARPNCYLEVGYAMGLGKKKNLILTVREDHRTSSPNFPKGGPRVHFDLEGYDILSWDPTKPDDFRAELEKRIKRRLAVVRPTVTTSTPLGALVPSLDVEWRDSNRSTACAGLERSGFSGYWEAVVEVNPKGSWTQQELLNAVENSVIQTFGWPIGIALPQDQHRPRPTAGGVKAEIMYIVGDRAMGGGSYDYWNIQRTGDFYFLRNLFEDTRSSDPKIYFNTRIVQVTELLLFLARLYARLGVTETTSVRIWLRHGGLRERNLSVLGGRYLMMLPRLPSAEEEITTELLTTVGELETKLTEYVKELLSPTFTLFDFFELDDASWSRIVDKFVGGEVS